MTVKIARRKALALLSYLAATGKPQARDSLATLFWPDYGQSEARIALSRHLYDLNKILGNDLLCATFRRVIAVCALSLITRGVCCHHQRQAVLPQLAIFRGGFRLAEVQAATGASRLLLTGLVDKSRLSVSVEGRFDLHERLRQYLLEKLREDLAVYQAVHDHHSQVYLALLQLDRAEFNSHTTLQRLTADFDNIRAAWYWAIDHNHWSVIRQARRGLHFFCLHKGWYLEEDEFYERTISRLQQRLAQSGIAPETRTERETETEAEAEIQLLLIALHCHRGSHFSRG